MIRDDQNISGMIRDDHNILGMIRDDHNIARGGSNTRVYCSHPPQNQHLLFYIQACSNFSVTSHGYVVRNRNIHYKFNAFFRSI
jgi:hypothetical protein